LNPPISETTLVIGMLIAFMAGIILGYAFKYREHEREIKAILNLTRPKRREVIVQAETERTPKGPPARPVPTDQLFI